MDLSIVKKAICYIRKSREDVEAEKRGEDTLAKQRDLLLKDVLPRYEFEYDVAEEVASGDSIKDRPVFQKVFRDLETGKYQAIVCKDLTRLGRGSYGDMGKVYDLLLERRIFIITQGNVYDPAKREHQQHLRFNLFFAREEYEMIKGRLQDGKDLQARRGKWVQGASIPYGYRYNSKDKILDVYEEEAKIVRLIFDLYANKGYGAKKICTYLSRLGIPSPTGKKTWSGRTITFILERPAYIGYSYFRLKKRRKSDGRLVEHSKEDQIMIPNAHEAIIDQDLWDKTQERLNSTKNAPKVNLDFAPTELAALITCKGCGRKMIRQCHTETYTKKNGETSFYRKEYLYCRNCSVMVRYQNVEEQIMKVLEQMTTLDDKLFNEVLSESMKSAPDHRLKQEEILTTLHNRKKDLQQRLDFIFEKYEQGIYGTDDFLRRKADIQIKIEETEQSIAFAINNSQIKQQTVDVQTTRKNINHFLEMYKSLEDKSQKNEQLHALFDKVELKLIEKATRNKRERFDLYVRFKYSFLIPN